MRKIFTPTLVNYLLAVLLTATLLTTFSSCARNGYGCNGRSKCITRVR